MPSVDSPSQKHNQEADSLDLNTELRRVINNSVGSVQGRQTSESFFAVTYEELADQQIERISGKGTTARPNELERVDRIEQDLLSLVEQVRNIPTDKFILSDSTQDVNTPVSEE